MRTIRGVGSVLQDGQEVAEVEYSLSKVIEANGWSSIRGTIGVLSGRIERGTRYVLRPAIGQEVEFYATDSPRLGEPIYNVRFNDNPEG